MVWLAIARARRAPSLSTVSRDCGAARDLAGRSDGGEGVGDQVAEVFLEAAVAAVAVAGGDVVDLVAGEGGVDAEQVRHARLGRFVRPDDRLSVRYRAVDLLPYRAWLVEQVDDALRRRGRLRHFACRVLQVGDL